MLLSRHPPATTTNETTTMSFDAAKLRRAFAANAKCARAVTGPAPAGDLASAEIQAAALACGLDREEANQLAAECLLMAVDDADADPQKVRHQPGPAMLSVGAVFGYLAARREAAEGADPPAEPPYPAELLDELADALARLSYASDGIGLNMAHRIARIAAVRALDRYSAEVGRENVSAHVDKAIAEAGDGS